MSKPFISIIVAVYNGSKTLQRCIDSVSGQTYLNKELIIIDGGSTDDTVGILKKNNDKITYWKSEPDNGIYNAWNKALKHITGNWIYFLGSDDYLWKNDVLSQIVPYLIKAESEETKLVYGQVARVTETNDVCCVDGEPWEHTWNGIVLDGICTFTHQGMFHHRSLFETYGIFDESYKIIGDYELLLRAFKNGGNALFVNGLIVAGMQTGGVTSNCTKLVQEIGKARKSHHLKVITIPWLISYAWSICHTPLTYIVGDKKTRYLLNSGKLFVTHISHWKDSTLKK
ncbi:glycosyltransferase family 2 protein [Methanolobus sediminis]|uniref:Glycosyltransferase family 2 protein n=1 Tax=Methanolobus sediminis TaxID=3072978 RepID=A0AA51UJ15_9EURY|nr:glycosyltransferase family 2 protein [Methanolobus sediminis]WMW24315.1 glycosyltransferase family 2 protein [Methanolobus sediminis]